MSSVKVPTSLGLPIALEGIVPSCTAGPSEGYIYPAAILSFVFARKQVERSTNPNPNKHGHLVHYSPSHLWYVLAHTQLVRPR